VTAHTALIVLGSFLASAVEMVEALTIVLGVGVVRGWRAPLIGAACAALTLGALVVALGTALASVPIDALRFVVGALLLAFGVQWLRKAILRSSGFRTMHDEDDVFRRERARAASAAHGERAALDWWAFTVAFKGVLLEGLEVVFIVIAFGSAQGELGLAALGAGAAVVLVAAAGAIAHRPLARVPENRIKFAVGLLLTSFGCFWAAEGVGIEWPAGEASLIGVIAFFGVASYGFVITLRRRRLRPLPAVAR